MKEKSRTNRERKPPTAPGRTATAVTRTAGTALAGRGRITSEERRRLTAEAAYLRAQSRGFSGGTPEQDWYEAEAEIDSALLEHSQSE